MLQSNLIILKGGSFFMKCRRCGAKLGKLDYCTSCGASRNYVPEKDEENIRTEKYTASDEKIKKRSVAGMILSVFFVFVISIGILSAVCIREIFENNSIINAFDEIDWSAVEIGRAVDGYDKNTTLTQYIASFIDDPRMNDDGIDVILRSDELREYMKNIALNYNEMLFSKGVFMELSADDIVDIVRANESEISQKTDMPFDEIGDIIYNDINKQVSEPINSYNQNMGKIFSGAGFSVIRFMLSDYGLITGAVLLLAAMVVSAVSFRRAGNGIKTCGIIIIVPSLLIALTAVFSGFIVKFPVIHELMPFIKKSFIQFGFIFTGFGGIIEVFGVLMISAGNMIEKSRFKRDIRKANAAAAAANDEDEIYPEKSEPKVLQKVSSDAFSVTGKLPDVSEIVKNNNKVCPICGNINNSNAKFCRKCGSEIQGF